jgi:hypothetical protein
MNWLLIRRTALALAALAVVAFILIRTGMMTNDWKLCFDSYTGKYTEPPYSEQMWAAIQSSLDLLWPKTLTQAAIVYSAIFSVPVLIVVARAWWIQLAALSLLLMPFLSMLEDGHDCDRKGCVACEFVGLWAWFIQLPLVGAMLCLIVLTRLWVAGRNAWLGSDARIE